MQLVVIRIAPGKAVAFDKILLMPQELKVKTLVPQPFDDLLSVPATRFLLLFKSKRAGDVSVFDWKDETSRPLLSANASFRDAAVVRSFMIKKSSFVLLLVKLGEQTRFLGCQLDKEKPEVKDLSGLFRRGTPSDVRWVVISVPHPRCMVARAILSIFTKPAMNSLR